MLSDEVYFDRDILDVREQIEIFFVAKGGQNTLRMVIGDARTAARVIFRERG